MKLAGLMFFVAGAFGFTWCRLEFVYSLLFRFVVRSLVQFLAKETCR